MQENEYGTNVCRDLTWLILRNDDNRKKKNVCLDSIAVIDDYYTFANHGKRDTQLLWDSEQAKLKYYSEPISNQNT